MPNTARTNLAGLSTVRTGPQQLRWASQGQRTLFEYGPAPVLASGGFGASKTFGFALKILYLSDLYPGFRTLVARRVWDELKKTTMSTFFKIVPPEAWAHGGRNASLSDKILRLNPRLCDDGIYRSSEIVWAHMDDPNVETLIKGLEINAFLLDQAEEMEEEIFTKLVSRLGRWDQAYVPPAIIADYESRQGTPWPWTAPLEVGGGPIPPSYAMLTANPDDETHWLWRMFHPDSLEWQTKYRWFGYRMVHMSSLDNIFLPAQNRENLLAQGQAFIDRYVHGKWGSPEGQIHEIHGASIIRGTRELLRYFQDHCTLHRVLDHGDTAPTACVWFAVDPNGNVFVYRAYYASGKLVSQHREAIWERSHRIDGQPEKYQFQIADPAIFIKAGQKAGGRWSIADEYADTTNLPPHTAIFFRPGDNNEIGTRNRINEYLQIRPDRIHPITRTKGAPMLYFVVDSEDYHEGVDIVVRETKIQRRVQIGTEGQKPIFSDERKENTPDHSYDCVRYFIAARPSAVTQVPRPTAEQFSVAAIRARYKKHLLARNPHLGRCPIPSRRPSRSPFSRRRAKG